MKMCPNCGSEVPSWKTSCCGESDFDEIQDEDLETYLEDEYRDPLKQLAQQRLVEGLK